MKIAVYAIALNEVDFVERWYASAREADYIVIADTGSVDGLVEHADKLGINVVSIDVKPWRFDVAKNQALALVPDDYDIVVSLDMDEVLLPGWREKLEASWELDATILNHRYRNNANPWQWHSKIHNRKHCRWIGAVHETLEWSIPEKQLWNGDIYLDEQQDTTKSRASYIDLLHLKIDEGDRDWKTFYFLANEYQARGDLTTSIEQREHAFNNCKEPISRAYIAKNIGNTYRQLGNNAEAESWYFKSVDESDERESWHALAQFYYDTANWEPCLEAAQRCLEVTTRRDGYTHDPKSWGWSPYDLGAIAAYNTGNYDLALEYGIMAASMEPSNQRLMTNLGFYKEKQVRQ
jgi:tetratricopeptide (TPR) repeat protein